MEESTSWAFHQARTISNHIVQHRVLIAYCLLIFVVSDLKRTSRYGEYIPASTLSRRTLEGPHEERLRSSSEDYKKEANDENQKEQEDEGKMPSLARKDDAVSLYTVKAENTTAETRQIVPRSLPERETTKNIGGASGEDNDNGQLPRESSLPTSRPTLRFADTAEPTTHPTATPSSLRPTSHPLPTTPSNQSEHDVAFAEALGQLPLRGWRKNDTSERKSVFGSDNRKTASLNSTRLATASQFPQSTMSAQPPRLWESLPAANLLPDWMKGYFAWHARQIAELNETNWETKRFLVMRCLRTDPHCEGTSDRLHHVPVQLLAAYRSRRILMILWQRPYHLTEFLVAPPGGMNWTVPAWLEEPLTQELLKLGRRHPTIIREEEHVLNASSHTGDIIAAYTKVMPRNGYGRALFDSVHRTSRNNITGEFTTFDQIYHTLWSILFTPSPPVARIIQASRDELGLVPNQYISVHIRAMYKRDFAEKMDLIQRAVDCAPYLWRDAPVVYIASDLPNTTRRAIEYAGSKKGNAGRMIVGRLPPDNGNAAAPVHLDRGRDYLSNNERHKPYPVSAYYDTFVDLYLLAGGRCTVYGQGGYGLWASAISSNASCAVNALKSRCIS